MAGKYVKPARKKPLKTIGDPLEAAFVSAANWLEDYTEWATRHLEESANKYEETLRNYLRAPWKQELHERLLTEYYTVLLGHEHELKALGTRLREHIEHVLPNITSSELFESVIRKVVERARETIGRAVGAV